MALTKLPGFTLDSTSSFTFANANVTANLSAGNIKTDNILYANGTAWSFGSTYSNTNVAAYLPTYTGNITTGNLLTDNLLYANGTAWSFSNYSNTNVAAYLPTYTGNVSANYFIGNGSTLTSITGSNVTGYVPLANAANTATSATTAGTVTTAAQPNITSVGTLSSLSVTANITAGNINGGNAIVANYFVGNGSLLTGLPASYSNTNVAAYLPTYTGNINANYHIGNGSTLTNLTGANVTGYVPLATAANTAGTVTTNAQPNITSVGTLTSLTVSGNLTTGNLITSGTGGNISDANYVIANYFSGNGSLLTSITGANVTGYVPLANTANSATTAGTVTTAAQPNITSVGTLSSVSVSGDATITGNLTVSGTYTYANVTSFNVKDPIIEQGGNPNGTPLSSNDGKDRGQILHYYSSGAIDAFMGWDNSNSEFGFGSNVSVSSEVVTWNSYGNVRAGYFIGNGATLTSITGANVTGYVATASAANTAATVTTNAQPNITSVGTLTSLTSGLITATSGGIKVGNLQDPSGTNTIQLLNSNVSVTGNIVAGAGGSGNVTATYFIGNGSQLTGLPASYSNTNVAAYLPTYTGNVAAGNVLTNNLLYANGTAWTFSNYSNTNVAAYLPTYTGNVSANYFIGNGSTLTNITGANVTGYVPLANAANTATTATSATTAGTVTTNAQPNITSVGTLTSLTVSGNLTTGNLITSGTGGNISDANYVIANYFSGNGSLLTSITGANVTGYVPLANAANTATSATTAGTVTTAAQPNITSVGTLSSLSVTGNVTANYFIGNGATLTNLTGANVTGYVPLANAANTATSATTAGTVTTAAQPNITSVGTLSSLSVTGNVSANYFIGNGATLTSITGANVTGYVPLANAANTATSATTAGTVTTAAQPNITSVGTLSSLSVTANITAGNINGGNAIVANYFVGDGSLLTGLPASYSNTNVAAYLPTYTGNLSASNLSVTTSANLGAVGNITITGGSANYVLTTNGSGVLSWAAQTGGGGSSTSTTISVDNFTGNGVADTFTLSVTPTSVNSVFVNYNGAFVGRGSYSLSGANLTFGSIPANGSSIEVTTIEGLTIGSGAFTTRTATGDNTTVNYTVTSGATVSSVLVTLDGVLQTPTSDYTISGSTLTFTTAPASGVAIQIRELSVASASSSGGGSALLIQEEGSNLTATANTINFVGSGVTATNVGNVVTVTVSGASNTSIRAQAMTMGIIFGG